MRILVVDDDRAVRESLRRSLAFNGYQVDLAVDGKDALEAVQQRRPDAMVLDVMMPRLDGLEVCRRMREAGDELPILVLTARDAVSDRVAGLDAGADDYLPKPFALEELLARLRALLRRRTVDDAAAAEGTVLQFADLSLEPGHARGAPRGAVDQPDPHRVLAAGAAAVATRAGCSPARRSSSRSGATTSRPPATRWRSTSATCGARPRPDGEPRLIHTVRGVGYVLRESPP